MIISAMTKIKSGWNFAVARGSRNAGCGRRIDKREGLPKSGYSGKIQFTDYDAEIKDRYEVRFEDGEGKRSFAAKSYFPASTVTVKSKSIIYEYNLDAQFSRAPFFLAVGDEDIYENMPSLEEINDGSSKTELVFTAEKVAGSGELGENISNAVSRSVWHKIYDPFTLRTLLVEDRNKCNKYYSYDSTMLAAGALIQALMGEYKGAFEQIELCACDKILGAVTAWIIFCRTRNHKIIEKILPVLIENTPIDGNLVKADKMTLREIAYKQQNSPLKDIKNLDIYSLDMSCYKLLALDITHRMAVIAGNKKAEEISQAQKRLKMAINKNLFNDKLGLYMDRYLNGEFSSIYGANSFAAYCRSGRRYRQIGKAYFEFEGPQKFGGEYMVPTLPKSHPLYGKKRLIIQVKRFILTKITGE